MFSRRFVLAAAFPMIAAFAFAQAAAAQPASPSPSAVVASFFEAYLERVENIGSEGNPLANRAYADFDELSPAFIDDIDTFIGEQGFARFDPFLLAQDVPARIEIGAEVIAGDSASVALIQYWPSGSDEETARLLTVELVRANGNGRWLIESINEGDEALAARTVEAFYLEYADFALNIGNPLVRGAHRTMGMLSDRFIAALDGLVEQPLLADPVLCAQDIPLSYAISVVEVNTERAFVELVPYWPTGPDAMTASSPVTYTLVRASTPPAAPGTWLIDAVTCPRN
ncbi:MAG: hypothetical protein SNJ59_09730 [Aggregatilineales bacterium]